MHDLILVARTPFEVHFWASSLQINVRAISTRTSTHWFHCKYLLNFHIGVNLLVELMLSNVCQTANCRQPVEPRTRPGLRENCPGPSSRNTYRGSALCRMQVQELLNLSDWLLARALGCRHGEYLGLSKTLGRNAGSMWPSGFRKGVIYKHVAPSSPNGCSGWCDLVGKFVVGSCASQKLPRIAIVMELFTYHVWFMVMPIITNNYD